MATKIQASTISTSTSSWYSRLRAIQGKTPKTPHQSTKISKTADPAITAGTPLTATSINNFITALNGLQSNKILSYGSWTSYKPSSVTAGSKASASATYNKINSMLTSLESLNANYSTNSVYSENTNNITDSNRYNWGNSCEVNLTNSTYGDNGTNTVNEINARYCQVNSTCDECATRDNYSTCDNQANYPAYNHYPYGTNAIEDYKTGDGECYDWYECWTEIVTPGCWADCCVGHDGDCNTYSTWTTCGDNGTNGVEADWPDFGTDTTNSDDGFVECEDRNCADDTDYSQEGFHGVSTKYGVYNCGRDAVDYYDSTNGDYSDWSVDSKQTNCNTNSNYGEFNVT